MHLFALPESVNKKVFYRSEDSGSSKISCIELPSTRIRCLVSSLEAEKFLLLLFRVVMNYHRKQIYIKQTSKYWGMARISAGAWGSVFHVVKLTDGAWSLFEVPLSLSLSKKESASRSAKNVLIC